MWYHGEMVESFFDEEPDDSVAVEDEVSALGVLVADHGEEGYQLGGLREDVDILIGHLTRDGCCWFLGFGAVGGAHA